MPTTTTTKLHQTSSSLAAAVHFFFSLFSVPLADDIVVTLLPPLFLSLPLSLSVSLCFACQKPHVRACVPPQSPPPPPLLFSVPFQYGRARSLARECRIDSDV